MQGERKAKVLSQKKLANLTNPHRIHIGIVEGKEKNPAISTIYKIAHALKTSVADLVT